MHAEAYRTPLRAGGEYMFEAQWERLGAGYWQDAAAATLDG